MARKILKRSSTAVKCGDARFLVLPDENEATYKVIAVSIREVFGKDVQWAMGDHVGDTSAVWLYLTRESAVAVANDLNDHLVKQQDKVEKMEAEAEAAVQPSLMET